MLSAHRKKEKGEEYITNVQGSWLFFFGGYFSVESQICIKDLPATRLYVLQHNSMSCRELRLFICMYKIKNTSFT